MPAKPMAMAAIREAENQHLLEQSGANSVVVSSETAGRLLGIATTTPNVVEIIEARPYSKTKRWRILRTISKAAAEVKEVLP